MQLMHAHETRYFYSRPCGRGDGQPAGGTPDRRNISTHAPAGGATQTTPAHGATSADFYSRPCGRGDDGCPAGKAEHVGFLLTPLREGRHASGVVLPTVWVFLLTPLREGRRTRCGRRSGGFPYFYSRPCGRGDVEPYDDVLFFDLISTHAPAGGATPADGRSR